MAIFAAVDIGSNSVRLSIARLSGGRLRVLHQDREVTRDVKLRGRGRERAHCAVRAGARREGRVQCATVQQTRDART